MASSLKVYCIALFVFGVIDRSDALGIQKCVPLEKGPFSKCSLAGYNLTFPILSGLSKRSLKAIKSSVNYMIKTTERCSIGAVAETMTCAFVAPYCKQSSSKPFLPCKRVCSEFLKRCENSIPDFAVDLFVALCSMLPNQTAISGTCYEPPMFHTTYNSTTLGPLERGCSPVIVPYCKDIGYSHTLLTLDRQKTLYKHLYRKNYTDDDNATKPAPNSGAQTLINLARNYSRCGVNIRKLFCAEYIPPCFKHEGIAYYTACQDVCRNITKQCPEVFNSQLRFFLYCEKLAYGEPYRGFCKHTSWPKPMKWIDIFQERRPLIKPTVRSSGIGGGAIAAVIVVPVVIVGTIIAVVFLYKKRKQTSQGYARQEDDNVEIFT